MTQQIVVTEDATGDADHWRLGTRHNNTKPGRDTKPEEEAMAPPGDGSESVGPGITNRRGARHKSRSGGRKQGPPCQGVVHGAGSFEFLALGTVRTRLFDSP